MPYPDLTGQRFGRLTVLGLAPDDPRPRRHWRCRCDCGNETSVATGYLKRKERPIRSCGCLLIDVARSKKTRLRHGHSPRLGESATYRIWKAMHQRCTNPNHKDYALYGGRGIRVCERWQTFENFLSDMGERPHGMSIDRIKNDEGYKPENCRWTRPVIQALNTRRTLMSVDRRRELQRRADLGESIAALAASFGVSDSAARAIARHARRI